MGWCRSPWGGRLDGVAEWLIVTVSEHKAWRGFSTPTGIRFELWWISTDTLDATFVFCIILPEGVFTLIVFCSQKATGSCSFSIWFKATVRNAQSCKWGVDLLVTTNGSAGIEAHVIHRLTDVQWHSIYLNTGFEDLTGHKSWFSLGFFPATYSACTLHCNNSRTSHLHGRHSAQAQHTQKNRDQEQPLVY